MKILILGGFLGSGKTSVLVNLAKHVIGDEPGDLPKVVIIENEIGEVGVDDVMLSSSGLQVQSMFSGCICCTMAGELIPTLRMIQTDYDPELVVVEATGVACPKQIRDSLVEYIEGSDVRICVVVDANRWDRIKRALSQLVHTQLLDANTILVNKIDLVEEDKPDQIIEELKEDNPDPEYFKISATSKIDPTIWSRVLGEDVS